MRKVVLNDADFRVTTRPTAWRRSRVLVVGNHGIEQPTRPQDPDDPEAVRMWRAYRRALIGRFRTSAQDALRRAGRGERDLPLDREGVMFLIDGGWDYIIEIKRTGEQ